MTKVVFMGDSITEYIPYVFKGSVGCVDDEIKYFGAENIGVGNYMKYGWPHVDHDNVDYYVLLIGINNILRPNCDYDNRETLNDLLEKLKEFIDLIVSDNSGKLIVQSIYPTKYLQCKDDILFVNKKIEEYCNEIDVTYLDVYSLLKTEEDLLNEEYSDDGIHPTNAGYNVIINEINNFISLNIEHKMKKIKDS